MRWSPEKMAARNRWLGVAMMAVLAGAGRVLASDDGITVTGVGTVTAKPTEVEIDGSITGDAELAADANVKFRDIRKKAIAALEGLKNPDLTVETNGSDIHDLIDPAQQQMMMQGQPANGPIKSRVQISERLKLTLKNTDKLDAEKLRETVLKLIDATRDAGVTVGPPPASNYYEMQMRAQNGNNTDTLVMFKVPDSTELQAQAYKLAVEDAKRRGQQLADLSGVTLGKVVSINDEGATVAPPNKAVNNNNNNNGDQNIVKEISIDTLGDIPLTVKVTVQFAITAK